MLVSVNIAQNRLQTENIDYLPPNVGSYFKFNVNNIACITKIYH
jgi:hypothetical protein